MKKIFLSILSIILLSSCNSQEILDKKNEDEQNKKINISTSIIPLASISNYIGWEYVNAKSLIPSGVSAHGYDIKAGQMIDIEESDLVIYLWIEHIDWFLDKVLSKSKNFIKVGENIELIEWKEHNHEHESNDIKEDSNEEKKHTVDPHVWTSWKNAIIIANHIKDKLIEIDNKNSTYYKNNFERFSRELNQIKNDYLGKHDWLEQKEFLVFHDAYNYLFEELNINENKKLIFQKNVLSDPNSKNMKKLIDEIRNHSIEIAFKEPQLNDKNLQKISNEYNINIQILNPLWSDSSKNWYINNYINNIKNLEYIYE